MEGLIFFVFLVIAGVSWAINFAKQQEMQQKRLEQQKQRRRGKSGMQVDDFLGDDEIEVVPASRRGASERRPPADRRAKQRDDIWREQTRNPQHLDLLPSPLPSVLRRRSNRQRPGLLPLSPVFPNAVV